MKWVLIVLNVLIIDITIFSQDNCHFSLLSNDTMYNDYIENVFDDSEEQQIIAIGTKFYRDFSVSSFHGPVFQKFDYCGNKLIDKRYEAIDSLIILGHYWLETNLTKVDEPVQKRTIKDNNGLYCTALRVADTMTSSLSLMLVGIDNYGNIRRRSLPFSLNEDINCSIRNIKLLNDKRILLILDGCDAVNGKYWFLYFDERYRLLEKRQIHLNSEIFAIEEIEGKGFICAAYGLNLGQYKVFKMDSMGSIAWEYNPYPERDGAVRQIKVLNNKIIIVGSVGGVALKSPGLGLITELDFEGALINQISISKDSGAINFCSFIIDGADTYYIAGYETSRADARGSDIILYRIDNQSKTIWDTSYNFVSLLGTSNGGFYNDYGGFDLIETMDRSLVTFGGNVYSSVSSKVNVVHKDGIIIKTRPGFLTKSEETSLAKSNFYTLEPNPVVEKLHIRGNLEKLERFRIFDFQGLLVLSGNGKDIPQSVQDFAPGLYILQVMDANKVSHNLKFVKM